MSANRVMPADAARAVGRFSPDGVEGYRAATMPNAPLRATREEAVEDERAWLDRYDRLVYVTETMWKRSIPHGYAITREDGTRWMMLNSNGSTVLAPVSIIPDGSHFYQVWGSWDGDQDIIKAGVALSDIAAAAFANSALDGAFGPAPQFAYVLEFPVGIGEVREVYRTA